MPTHTKPHDGNSPLDILTELAVEGTSSLVEAQRAFLDLVQRENNIILNGLIERFGGFLPAAATTDLVRRSLDTFIEAQQELLTATSKQTIEWLESSKAGKGDRAARLADFAREGVETFTRAQKKFLDVVAQETERVTHGDHKHDGKSVKKTELAQLAREAGDTFIEAQKRFLDVVGQQMNVNLDVTTRTMKMASPARLLTVANLAGEGVKSFVNAETSLIGSLIKPPKKAAVAAKLARTRSARQRKAVPV